MVVDVISQNKKFYIYGAQVVAYGAYRAIHHLCGRKPECFLVSSSEGNPDAIEGIPVMEAQAIPEDGLVIVAVTELLQGEVAEALEQKGFQQVFLLTQHEEHRLMSAYFGSRGMFPLSKKLVSDVAVDFAMYEVCNHRDKPLEGNPALAPFEHPIQAGAALAPSIVAEMGDDTGENISEKNRQYCEMSAVYWVWKNQRHDWVGIEHYRRHLLVTQEMLTDDVDVFLPLPYMCYPNTLAQFRRFVSESVSVALMQALRELHPQEYEGYRKILEGSYQYTYNLSCMRWHVFDAYCTWFFRITEFMETMAEHVPEIAETRALSYVAEVLTNLYFMSNPKHWRILHVEKAIYV